MGRLKALPPRVKAIGSRLQPAMTREESEAKRFRDRDAQQPWRQWYYSARWKRLRQEILVRDCYTCQKTGVLLGGKYPAGNSPVVDHVIPHRGDEALFWNPANLMTVSKEYHDRVKQAVERGQLAGLGDLIQEQHNTR